MSTMKRNSTTTVEETKIPLRSAPKDRQRVLIPRCAMEISSRRHHNLEHGHRQEGKYEEEKKKEKLERAGDPVVYI